MPACGTVSGKGASGGRCFCRSMMGVYQLKLLLECSICNGRLGGTVGSRCTPGPRGSPGTHALSLR